MLYTVVASRSIWAGEDEPPVQPAQPMRWGRAWLLVSGDGVVETVLSSDPAVFLTLNTRCPCGRIR